ncbi:PDZ and LIM domain protein 2-like [Athalia rosae]|uniref:PDZ and LIM domain protein 2-like n=1 Tax=Athalia rosae TaxID=37344 RepID=UPI0020347460|nr:PDZ and LIM domain protein 2-like [Athalia rosae]XP_048509872.1 PDZ and LIM domain protein 2-like [Athalia rosae]XP_048509873.1 PDZ and LIM domain protein 2-like [Athalia rosae]XP_048509874.1 PDZ and LIM domain protein 2-like [Athalia rosae]
MATDIKLSRFNNTPWGFRLSGGVDFPHPLTVVRVARGSLADDAGLQPGDVLIRINDSPIQDLTHAQAHQWLLRAGNNFVLSVVRNHRIATEAH